MKTRAVCCIHCGLFIPYSSAEERADVMRRMREHDVICSASPTVQKANQLLELIVRLVRQYCEMPDKTLIGPAYTAMGDAIALLAREGRLVITAAGDLQVVAHWPGH